MAIEGVTLRRLVAVGVTLVGIVALVLAVLIGSWAAVLFFFVVATIVIATVWRADRPFAWICGVAMVTLGPFAGPVLLIAVTGFTRHKSPLLSDTERQVPLPTRAERICAEIAEGRRPLPDVVAVPCLAETFAAGDLASQQAALSAIVRHFSPELRPALDHALASDIPAVRVQAAAVFAHLRDAYAARAHALVLGTSGLTGPAWKAEVEAVTQSGFVDPMGLSDVASPECREPPPAPSHSPVVPLKRVRV